jgi:hypothetical protein
LTLLITPHRQAGFASIAAAVPLVAMTPKPSWCRSLRQATARTLSAVLDGDHHRALARQARAGAELALEHGLAEGAAAPMTSPVERISGPRMGSTPGNLLNGNTASLTLKYGGTTSVGASRRALRGFSDWPAMQRAAILASGWPVALLTKGTVRDARGLTSST